MKGAYRFGIKFKNQKELRYVLVDSIEVYEGMVFFLDKKGMPDFIFNREDIQEIFAASILDGSRIAED